MSNLEEQLRARLDINKDGKLSADDVMQVVRTYEVMRLALGFVLG